MVAHKLEHNLDNLPFIVERINHDSRTVLIHNKRKEARQHKTLSELCKEFHKDIMNILGAIAVPITSWLLIEGSVEHVSRPVAGLPTEAMCGQLFCGLASPASNSALHQANHDLALNGYAQARVNLVDPTGRWELTHEVLFLSEQSNLDRVIGFSCVIPSDMDCDMRLWWK